MTRTRSWAFTSPQNPATPIPVPLQGNFSRGHLPRTCPTSPSYHHRSLVWSGQGYSQNARCQLKFCFRQFQVPVSQIHRRHIDPPQPHCLYLSVLWCARMLPNRPRATSWNSDLTQGAPACCSPCPRNPQLRLLATCSFCSWECDGLVGGHSPCAGHICPRGGHQGELRPGTGPTGVCPFTADAEDYSPL